jgi:hypothetical protein
MQCHSEHAASCGASSHFTGGISDNNVALLIWSPPICKAIVLGEKGGCGLIHGLVPFAKSSGPQRAGVGLHIYIRPVDGTVVPGPNGFRPTTPSYIHGFESPKSAQVQSSTVRPVLPLNQITCATNEEVKQRHRM